MLIFTNVADMIRDSLQPTVAAFFTHRSQEFRRTPESKPNPQADVWKFLKGLRAALADRGIPSFLKLP